MKDTKQKEERKRERRNILEGNDIRKKENEKGETERK